LDVSPKSKEPAVREVANRRGSSPFLI
jgi:hypothetical protein